MFKTQSDGYHRIADGNNHKSKQYIQALYMSQGAETIVNKLPYSFEYPKTHLKKKCFSKYFKRRCLIYIQGFFVDGCGHSSNTLLLLLLLLFDLPVQPSDSLLALGREVALSLLDFC